MPARWSFTARIPALISDRHIQTALRLLPRDRSPADRGQGVALVGSASIQGGRPSVLAERVTESRLAASVRWSLTMNGSEEIVYWWVIPAILGPRRSCVSSSLAVGWISRMAEVHRIDRLEDRAAQDLSSRGHRHRRSRLNHLQLRGGQPVLPVWSPPDTRKRQSS
jgi:hypothetical protein